MYEVWVLMSRLAVHKSSVGNVLRGILSVLALPLGYFFSTGSMNLLFRLPIGMSPRSALVGLLGFLVAGIVLFAGYKAGRLPTRTVVPRWAYYQALFLPFGVAWVPHFLWWANNQSMSLSS